MSGSVRDPPSPPRVEKIWEEQFVHDIPLDIEEKLRSRDQTVYQEGQEELSNLKARQDHAVNEFNSYGEQLFVPNDLMSFAQADMKFVQENQLSVNLVANYWKQFFSVMKAVYRTSYRGTQFLTGRVYNDPRVLEARCSILVQYLAPYALEGNALNEDWHDLYDDWAMMLQNLMDYAQPLNGMRLLAEALRAFLSYRAFGTPDLMDDSVNSNRLLQNLSPPNFYGATHDGYPGYDPSPITILEGLKERLENGRGTVLNAIPTEQQKTDHHHAPSYQDAISFVDPVNELIDWANDEFALERL